MKSKTLLALFSYIANTINTSNWKIIYLPANSNVWFKVNGTVKDNIENLKFTAIASDSNGNQYRANLVEYVLPKQEAKISLTSPQDKAYIKVGDKVEYDITVTNTGNYTIEADVIDAISDYLEVLEIYEITW